MKESFTLNNKIKANNRKLKNQNNFHVPHESKIQFNKSKNKKRKHKERELKLNRVDSNGNISNRYMWRSKGLLKGITQKIKKIDTEKGYKNLNVLKKDKELQKKKSSTIL